MTSMWSPEPSVIRAARRDIFDDNDLALGVWMIEPDRHRLSTKLHPDQPIEDLRTKRPEVIAGGRIEKVLEVGVGR